MDNSKMRQWKFRDLDRRRKEVLRLTNFLHRGDRKIMETLMAVTSRRRKRSTWQHGPSHEKSL